MIAGIALRHPLTRIPENTVKYAVGVMLTAFGTFSAGEGLGVVWWRDDLFLLPLIAIYGSASYLFVQILRNPPELDSSASWPCGMREMRSWKFGVSS